MALSRITTSTDGRFLQDADGDPFFWLGDTAWTMCARLDRDETERYFDDRATKGFTVIQAVAAGGPWYTFEADNRYGEAPFVGADPMRPNERYFEHIDWVLECAASHGLRMGLLPVWAGTEIRRGGTIDEEKARSFGEWIASRYRAHGVLWVLGGDTMPVRTVRPDGEGADEEPDRSTGVPTVLEDFRPVFDAFAAGILAGYGEDAFITYHPTAVSADGASEPRTSLYFGDRSWLTMNMLQTSHLRDPGTFLPRAGVGGSVVWSASESHLHVTSEYRSLPTRPIVDGEPRYEDIPIDLVEDGSHGFWTGYDARNAAYHAVFAGAAGHTYGNHSIWQMFGAGAHEYELGEHCIQWEEAMTSPASTQMGHLRELLLSRPYFGRIPDQSILSGPALPGESHVQATRDRDGSWAMVYLPKGGTVTVDLLKVSGTLARAWWLDPRTGEATLIGGDLPTSGERRFVAPTTGPADDWVLVIDDAARGYANPGRVAA